jgi:hypothetical protein
LIGRGRINRLVVAVAGTALATATVALPSRAHAADRGQVDPASFVNRIDNPWYPLAVGSTRVYRGVEGGTPSRDIVTVISGTKTILGVRCVVVHDNLYVDGRLAERTTDWFAQDRKGNVWYFGEATAELGRGRVTTTKGSWQAGVDGARPGIVMPAHPRVGQVFRQEYLQGIAEDRFEILSLSTRVDVPYVSSRRALETKEWTPLEPGLTEQKYYVRGVGLVREGSTALVTVS